MDAIWIGSGALLFAAAWALALGCARLGMQGGRS